MATASFRMWSFSFGLWKQGSISHTEFKKNFQLKVLSPIDEKSLSVFCCKQQVKWFNQWL